ncbi:MAG: hypothetical protein H6907_00645 [Hyphomicrobiales bacterium]|nr:hypothetical protein [Hyphomicrobiales bacterium]
MVDDLDVVLLNWRANSRVSPIWRLEDPSLGADQPDIHSSGTIFFVAMMNPAELELALLPRGEQELPSLRILCTLGVFNIILSVATASESEVLQNFLAESMQSFEVWRIENETCQEMEIYRKTDTPAFEDFDLTSIESEDPKINAKHLELFTNILAAASRGKQYIPWVVDDLTKIVESYRQSLDSIVIASPDRKNFLLDAAYYRVINANSSISRFSSQALSGTQPIETSECHYWPHSALGIGIANCASRNVAAIISKKISEFDFVQRLVDLEGIAYKYSERPVDLTLEQMENDFLSSAPSIKNEKINPICFFSGRDNFRHDVYSLSLPLESIDLATTYQWSLQTITHELTHRLIEPIMGLLLPDDHTELFDSKGKSKAYMEYRPADMLDAARIGLLDALMAYARSQNSDFVDDYVRDTSEYEILYEFIIQFSDFIEEFLVHTFDFLYFYERDPEEYVKSLWVSWGIIPHLEDKLDDYIVRTIVALSSNTLHINDCIEVAKDQFLHEIENDFVKDNNPHYDVIKQKVANDSYWLTNLKPKVVAGNVSARFVITFLYSGEAHKMIYEDSALGSGDSYGITRRSFASEKYENPLRLLKEYSGYQRGTEADSLWLFHILTFNVEDVP